MLHKIPGVLNLHLGILKHTMEKGTSGEFTSSTTKDLRRISIPETLTVPFTTADGMRSEQILYLADVNYHKGNPIYGPVDAKHGHAIQTFLVGGKYLHYDDHRTPTEVSYEQAVTPGPRQNILMVRLIKALYLLFSICICCICFYYLIYRYRTKRLITAKTQVPEMSTPSSDVN